MPLRAVFYNGCTVNKTRQIVLPFILYFSPAVKGGGRPRTSLGAVFRALGRGVSR